MPLAGSPTSMPPGPVVVCYLGKDAGPALLSAAAVEGRGQLSCSTDLRPALWPNIGRLHGMRREGHLSCGHFTSWQMRGGATSTHTHEPLTWSPQPHGRLCCATQARCRACSSDCPSEEQEQVCTALGPRQQLRLGISAWTLVVI